MNLALWQITFNMCLSVNLVADKRFYNSPEQIRGILRNPIWRDSHEKKRAGILRRLQGGRYCPLAICYCFFPGFRMDLSCGGAINQKMVPGSSVNIRYITKPINPISSIPAPATFAIIINSSLLGFLASLSTRVYSPSLIESVSDIVQHTKSMPYFLTTLGPVDPPLP